MTTILLILLVVLVAALLFVVAPISTRAFLRFRGQRVVTCPENKTVAAVEVNAGRAALSAVIGQKAIRLADCSRWPEKQGCGQECLAQIEAAPRECLVQTQVSRWYEGKACVYCKRPFGEIPWALHRPALLTARGELVEWKDVKVENLSQILADHWPVCWDCLVTEAIRRQHPELITDRPERTHPG